MSSSQPPPPPDQLTPIDLRFRDEVFTPWERESHAIDRPWEATPDLRAGWLELLQAGDRLDREIGFLAISRCTRLTETEKNGLAAFWNEGKDFQHIQPAAALRLLLSGGSPHESLFDIYFSNMAPQSVAQNPISKTLLSMLTRHPHLGPLADMMSVKIGNHYLGFSWGLNPSLSPEMLVKLACDPNPWTRATAFLNPSLPLTKALESADPLIGFDYVALSLRPDLTPAQWDQISSRYFPEEEFLFVLSEHPAAKGSIPPAMDWTNPTRETIEYFSQQTYIGALWRWWSPLMTMPWLADQVSDIGEPGVLLAFLLYGAPREIMNESPALNSAIVRLYMRAHPGVLLEEFYRNRASEAPVT